MPAGPSHDPPHAGEVVGEVVGEEVGEGVVVPGSVLWFPVSPVVTVCAVVPVNGGGVPVAWLGTPSGKVCALAQVTMKVSAKTTHIEFWFQFLDKSTDPPYAHLDFIEYLEKMTKRLINPILSSILFLTSGNCPTLVVDNHLDPHWLNEAEHF